MANLADAILRTLQIGSGGAEETQARVMNNQQMQENRRIQQAQADRDWMAKVANTELFNDFKVGGKGEAPYSFDVISAYNKDPQLALSLFDGYSRSLFNARDEKGRPIQVKPVAIRPVNIEGQEMFAVEVERPDGKRAPLTRGGTPAGDDNVILMTREDLNGLASQRLGTMANSGAMSAVPMFARMWQGIPDAAARDNAVKYQAIRDEVDAMFDDDEIEPEARREVFALFSALDGPELEEAARDMGIDVDAVVAELQAKASTAVEEAAPAAQPTPSTETPARGLMDSVLNPAWEDKIAPPPDPEKASVLSTIGAAPQLLSAAALGAAGKMLGRDKPAAPEVVATPEQRAAGAEFFGGLIQKAQASPVFKAAADYVSGALAPDSTKSSVTPELAAAPQPVQQAVLDTDLSPEDRRNAILGAIEQGLQAPTEQQRAVARDFMINNKVQSPQDLSTLPGPEVMNLAWVLASADPNLTVSERMKVAQGVINFAQFGNPETSAADVAKQQLDQARLEEARLKRVQDAEISAATLRMRYAEHVRSLGKDSDKAQEALREMRNEATKQALEVRKGIPRDKRKRIKGAPTPEADAAMDALFTGYENAVAFGDEPEALAYAAAVDDALPDYVASFVIAEPQSFLDGFANLGGVIDWLGRAPFRNMKTDFGDFIIERNSAGEPTKLALVTPKGVKAEKGVIKLTPLKQRLGEEKFTYFMEMLEKQEAANASKRSK